MLVQLSETGSVVLGVRLNCQETGEVEARTQLVPRLAGLAPCHPRPSAASEAPSAQSAPHNPSDSSSSKIADERRLSRRIVSCAESSIASEEWRELGRSAPSEDSKAALGFTSLSPDGRARQEARLPPCPDTVSIRRHPTRHGVNRWSRYRQKIVRPAFFRKGSLRGSPQSRLPDWIKYPQSQLNAARLMLPSARLDPICKTSPQSMGRIGDHGRFLYFRNKFDGEPESAGSRRSAVATRCRSRRLRRVTCVLGAYPAAHPGDFPPLTRDGVARSAIASQYGDSR